MTYDWLTSGSRYFDKSSRSHAGYGAVRNPVNDPCA